LAAVIFSAMLITAAACGDSEAAVQPGIKSASAGRGMGSVAVRVVDAGDDADGAVYVLYKDEKCREVIKTKEGHDAVLRSCSGEMSDQVEIPAGRCYAKRVSSEDETGEIRPVDVAADGFTQLTIFSFSDTL